jgi:hypothetical protein
MTFSALAVSAAALPAFGGELEPIRVSVPFAFTAGKASLPAGDYTVSENDSHVFMIRGTKGSIILLGTPGSDTDDDRSALSFERTDKGYLLRTVRSSGHAASLVTSGVATER